MVCVGAVTLDTIAVVDTLPAEDERVAAEEVATAGGGPAATAAVTLARMGVAVALVGVVGDDAAGGLARQDLAREGVDVSCVRRDPEAPTAQSVVLVRQPNGSRTIVTSASGPLRPEDVPLSPRWLHVDQAGYEVVRRALARTPGTRPRLSVDGGNDIPDLDLSQVTLYAPTVAALGRRFPGARTEDAMRLARDQGAEHVVATAGAAGCLVLDGEEVVRIPPTKVPVTSTLGAGDVFHGALLAGLVRGEDLVAAAALAGWVAALSCRALDGRSGIPGPDELGAAAAGPDRPSPPTGNGA